MATFEPLVVDDAPKIESHSAAAAVLNADIETLVAVKDTVQATLVKTLLGSVIVILILVRDEMIQDESFLKLARACVRTCHVLMTVTKGRDMDGLSDASEKQIEDLGRIVRHIESVVSERTNCGRDLPGGHPGSTDEYLISLRAEMWDILRVLDRDLGLGAEHVQRSVGPEPRDSVMTTLPLSLNEHLRPDQSSHSAPTPSFILEESLDLVEDAVSPVLTGTGGIDMGESVPPSPPLPGNTKRVSEPPLILSPSVRALQRLVSRDVPQDELRSVIETIISNVRAADIVECLQESGAQTFVDVMDEALGTLDFASQIRRKCVKSLYKACAGHVLLPSSLHLELHGDPVGTPLHEGGFGDVRKREYRGREVAVKDLRVNRHKDLRGVTSRFCKEVITWRSLRHPNVLPLLGVVMSKNRLAMVSEWMENENINQFVTAHPDANRFELLGDVARGLIHMHGQGMIHGDLKGANILVDQNHRACLADFGLLRIASDGTNITSSSFLPGGSYRWMSPELFDPEEFGLKDGRQTKHSDCYALGMVIYEVLSGQVPFSWRHDYAIIGGIIKGERPRRPRGAVGAWFTDDIWSILECCWKPRPADRPNIKEVFRCLEKVSRSWTPSSPQAVAGPPTTSLFTSNSGPNVEGSDGDASLPSSEESGEIMDRMPPANIDPREVRLRRRCTCNGGDVPRQSHATPNEGLLRGGLLDVPGVVGVFQSARDEKVAGIETWEPHDPAFVELIEKEDFIAKEKREPNAFHPVGILFQSTFEWMKNEKPLIGVFFFGS